MTNPNVLPMLTYQKPSGFWANQTYHRLNVFTYIDAFCGWPSITEMISYAEEERNRAFLTFLIKTGGRASEVLGLTAENFQTKPDEKLILVTNMALLKHYKKLDTPDPTTGKRSKPIAAIRKPFAIPIKEPLTAEMQSYLEGKEGLLFSSPYKSHKPLTRVWAYRLIRQVNDLLPQPLFRRLGLNRPFLDDKGEVIEDKIHLWLHWARSQRASQLASEYDFSEAELMEWFGWMDYATALHYSHLGYQKLASKMMR